MGPRSGSTWSRVRRYVSRSREHSRTVGTLALSIVCASLLSGCTQLAKVMCEPLALVYDGDAAGAVGSLDKTAIARSKNDRFLYRVQRGHLLHLAGDYEESNREFERAAAIADDLEPLSVTAMITDYTFNEAAKEYGGEDFERVYLHHYMALNYLMMGDDEEASVELKRLDQKLRDLDAQYDDDGRYQEDGYIRYLSGLVYESLGQTDDAFIDYRLAVGAYGRGAADRAPLGLTESLVCAGRSLGAGEAVRALVGTTSVACAPEVSEIVVVIESGWAPYKEEASSYVPLFEDMVAESSVESVELGGLVKVAVARFVSASAAGRGFTAEVTRADRDGSAGVGEDAGSGSNVGWSARAELVQNVEALARSELERRLPGMMLRSVMRATAKQIALAALRSEPDDEDESDDGHSGEDDSEASSAEDDEDDSWLTGFFRSILGGLVKTAVTVAVAETEQADTRSWLLLPADIWLVRIPVEPGDYTLSVVPEGAGSAVSLGEVRVDRGEKVIRSCRIFGGPHPMECESES